MSEKKPNPERLLDEAIDLIIRLQNDPENPVALQLIDDWRARSDGHEVLWQKVSAAHGMSGKVLNDRAKKAKTSSAKINRRKLMIGAAGVGVVAASASLLPDAIIEARADYVTGKGEIRNIDLSDGGLAVLGPESALALDYGAARRGIGLLRGMCYFEVAKDLSRPFVVDAGGLSARAMGTAFDVSVEGSLVSVAVAEGAVDTRSRDRGIWADASLGAGHWMTFNSSSHQVMRGIRDISQIAAWRRAVLIANGDPVSALIERISRWCPGRVILADPFIGEQKVSGLFDLSEPHRALEAVVHPVGGRVRKVSSHFTVITPF